MNLKNNSITVRELLSYPAAAAVLEREFPRLIHGRFIGIVQNTTLSELIEFARSGHFVPEKKIAAILSELGRI